MAANVRAEIARQVARVRRRVFLTDLIRRCFVAVAAALAATTAWLIAQPFVIRPAPEWLTWAVLGGMLGIGFLTAMVFALIRRPDATRSALWLDEAFGLRERAVTSLSLSDSDAATPAGQALLTDALANVKDLRVGERFPVRVGWQGALVPSAAAVLALVAVFYDPVIGAAQGTTEGKQLTAAEKADLEKKLEAMQRPKVNPKVDPDRPKSDDLKKLEAKLDEIARQPRNTTSQLRERVKDMTPLEDEIKKLERERADKARMLQQQLALKDALSPNDSPRDGPADAFQKALADGDIDKARDEMDKLAKKLANNELSEEDKQQLGKQLNDLQKKLDNLAKQANKEEMLKKLAQEGKLDPEALQRELQQLKQDNEKLKDLQKLADKLNQCQNCAKAGDTEGMQKALQQAAKQLGDMARDSQEIDDLRDTLQNLKEAKDAMARALDEVEPCPGGT